MIAKQVVPAVAIHHGRGFAVDGDVTRLVVRNALSRFGIELDLPDEAEEGPVSEPQPAIGGIEEERRIDGIAILDAVGRGDDGVVIEIRNRGIAGRASSSTSREFCRRALQPDRRRPRHS